MRSLVKGFSLVEMAISLVIMSVVAGVVFSIAFVDSKNSSENTNLEKMNEIQNAITAFANANNFIPCPADITTAVNTSAFGTSGTNCNANIAGDITVGSFSLRIGMVPVRTLNLPDDYAFDAWGNRIRYAVVKELAINSTTFTNFASNFTGLSPNARTFEIRDAIGNPINRENIYTSPVLNNSIAYVLLSHGENGNGAVPFSGGTPPTCPASGLLDEENCNGDAIFRDTLFSTASSNYFDDYIRWKTYNQLRIDAGLAGSAANVTSPPVTADYAHFEFFADCTGCGGDAAMWPPTNGYGNGNWNQRPYNTVHKNFNQNPAVTSSGGSNGDFTLTPGRYTIITKNYFFTSIATTVSCRVINTTLGFGISSATQNVAANTDGNIVVLTSANISANTTFRGECSFNPFGFGQTRFTRDGQAIAVYDVMIWRH